LRRFNGTKLRAGKWVWVLGVAGRAGLAAGSACGGVGSGWELRGRRVGGRQRLPHFEAFQFFIGAVPGALAGIDDPLETLEGEGVGGEGVAGCAGYGGFDIFYQEGVAGGEPELGLDAASAAEAPLVGNERIDEEALLGIGGLYNS